MTCPICSGSSSPSFEVRGYPILSCKKCGHQFIEGPPLTYDDNYFADEYGDYLAAEQYLRATGRWYASLIGKPGRILDVGAAAGFLLKGFQDAGWEGIGLEPSATMVEYGQKNLGPNMQQGSLETFESSEQFDLVSMIQVVPHFYDIRAALEVAARATKPGGLWLVETLRRDSWVFRLCGRRWYEYNPPSVRHWFTMQGLRSLFEQFGFQELKTGKAPKKFSSNQLKAFTARNLGKTAAKCIPSGIEISYPGDDIFWGLYKKNRID